MGNALKTVVFGSRWELAVIPYVAVLFGMYWLRSAWIAMLGYHLGMVAALTWTRNWPGASTLFRGWPGRFFVILVPLYLLAGALIYLLWPMVRLDQLVLGDALTALGLGQPLSWWLFVVYYCLVNPPLEELFWRGLLGRSSRGPIPSDLLFAGYHGLVIGLFVTLPWAAFAVALLTASAWIWRLMSQFWGGLAAPFVTHLIADVGVMVAVIALMHKPV